MHMLDLPPEILLHILSYSAATSGLDWLRITCSAFDNIISSNASHLFAKLVDHFKINNQVLYLKSGLSSTPAVEADQAVLQLLQLANQVQVAISLHDFVLKSLARYKIEHPTQLYDEHPSALFPDLNSLLLLSTFHSRLRREVTPHRIDGDSGISVRTPLAVYNIVNLSPAFMIFVQNDLTLEHLENLVETVDRCILLLLRWNSQSENISAEHKAIWVEHLLWRGLPWLVSALRTKTLGGPFLYDTCWRETTISPDTTRLEAVVMSRNGVSRLLWKERMRKLSAGRSKTLLGSTVAEKMKLDFRFDPVVRRGPAGGL